MRCVLIQKHLIFYEILINIIIPENTNMFILFLLSLMSEIVVAHDNIRPIHSRCPHQLISIMFYIKVLTFCLTYANVLYSNNSFFVVTIFRYLSTNLIFRPVTQQSISSLKFTIRFWSPRVEAKERIVFHDISKAFGRVWCYGLNSKLKRLEIRWPALSWFIYYLQTTWRSPKCCLWLWLENRNRASLGPLFCNLP